MGIPVEKVDLLWCSFKENVLVALKTVDQNCDNMQRRKIRCEVVWM